MFVGWCSDYAAEHYHAYTSIMLLPDQTYEQNNTHIESMLQSYHKVFLNRHSRTYQIQEQHRTCLNDDPNAALSYRESFLISQLYF